MQMPIYNHNSMELIEKAFIPLYEKYQRREFVNGTVELIDAHLKFEPTDKYINLGTKKNAPQKYIQKELNWYLSQSLSIKDHVDDVEIWSRVATKDAGRVNSNYGWCVLSDENYSQFDHALRQLIDSPNGRQSVCIYTRPSIQVEWNDGVHADHDFICTYATQHFIRDGRLEYIVYMRSNDAIFGLINDFAWHYHVYLRFMSRLSENGINLEPGLIHWNAGSLHIYERHYELLRDVVEEYKSWKIGLEV